MGDRQTQELGEKGDTDRGLLPLTDQQFRHRRKLHNGFKVLITGKPALIGGNAKQRPMPSKL